MFKDFFIYGIEFLPLGASATGRFRVEISGEADFQIFAGAHVATSRNYLIAVADSASGFQLHDQPEPSEPADTYMGAGQRPRKLRPAYIAKRKGSLLVLARDLSGAPNTIRAALIGAKIWPAAPLQIPKWTAKVPFTYAADFGVSGLRRPALGANAEDLDVIQIQADSWFLCDGITIVRTGAATVLITNSGPMGQWMDRRIHVDNLGANAIGSATNVPSEYEFRLPVPKLIPPASSLSVRMQDLSGAPNSIHVAFNGAKAYA